MRSVVIQFEVKTAVQTVIYINRLPPEFIITQISLTKIVINLKGRIYQIFKKSEKIIK